MHNFRALVCTVFLKLGLIDLTLLAAQLGTAWVLPGTPYCWLNYFTHIQQTQHESVFEMRPDHATTLPNCWSFVSYFQLPAFSFIFGHSEPWPC
jgi:hypothetical protein